MKGPLDTATRGRLEVRYQTPWFKHWASVYEMVRLLIWSNKFGEQAGNGLVPTRPKIQSHTNRAGSDAMIRIRTGFKEGLSLTLP